MAIIKQGILGAFSGKVGTVIGTSWKGIAIIRSIAASITQPNTAAQLTQRAKFAAVIAFLRPLTAFLRSGFKSAAVKMSGFNAAMSYTLKNAITGVYPEFAIDYTKALVSRGSLPGALNPQTVAGLAGKVDFSWDDNSQQAYTMADDKAVLVVYNPATHQAITKVSEALRSTGSDFIQLPDLFVADTVECYIAFTTASGSEISDSLWVGQVVVA